MAISSSIVRTARIRVLIFVASLAAAPQLVAYQAGVTLFEVKDPVSDRLAPALAVYPTSDEAAETAFGEYRVAARLQAAAVTGKFPLIVLSHGHGGSRFAHHALAVALARAGFIVAAGDHLGDNVHEAAEQLSASVLISRPRQISALIDAVLSHRILASRVDQSRIGVIGFSAGGFTALALVGAVPKLGLWKEYCREPKHGAALCPPPGDIDHVDAGTSLQDKRVRAAYLLAPFAIVFDRDGLKAVTAPVRIVAGARDPLLTAADNAWLLHKHLPRRSRPWIVDQAAHFTFLSPCSASLRAIVPNICEDAAGVDREAIHKRIHSDAVQFFRRHVRH